jgi:hypothetical protein
VPLRAHVPLVAFVVHVGRPAVPDRHARHGHLEVDRQEDREVPLVGDFVAVQEDAVHEQDRSGWYVLQRRVDQLVGVQVVDSASEPVSSAPAEGDEQLGPESGVVEGVEPETLRRGDSPGVARGAHPVEVVDRSANDLATSRPEHIGEFVGEHRLPGTVHTVDGDPQGGGCLDEGHRVGDLVEQLDTSR